MNHRLSIPALVAAVLCLLANASAQEPAATPAPPQNIIFLRGHAPESSTPNAQTQFFHFADTFKNSRAYFELDTLGPAMPGRELYSLALTSSNQTPKLLYSAGTGLIGSPSVSYDGQQIFFSLAPQGEKFFHIYSIPAQGGEIRPITSGPFHDFDPEPLPDGRLVFSSTRLGIREEYHGNPARSLFVMNADGSGIHPITTHIVGDTEPKVTASGLIAFIRQDNFMERAKVETHIHVVRPDGTAPHSLLGPERGALEYDRLHASESDGKWLRSFGFGSPAPLPDGRVAALSSYGLVISGTQPMPPPVPNAPSNLLDISALPDGRLLGSTRQPDTIGIFDITNRTFTPIFDKMPQVHSPVFLGARKKPALPASTIHSKSNNNDPTGFLIGESVFLSKQTNAELWRVKAIRVLEGKPFATRSVRHQYSHLGVEAVELGTAPLAPDGSFYVEVPADRALTLQGVDAEGRPVINEISWIYVRPGEQLSCVGCHYQQNNAPPASREILALRSPALPLLGKGNPVRFRGNNAANGGMLNLQFDRFREVASLNLHPGSNAATKDDVQALLTFLKNGTPDQKLSAAQNLALLRDRSTASALAETLEKTSRPDLRLNAALALAACGTRDSVRPLQNALAASQPAVAQAAHLALNNLLGQQIEFNPYGTKADRETGLEAWRTFFLLHNFDRIEKDLSEQLDLGDPANEEKIVVALGHIGTDRAQAALQHYITAGKNRNLRATLAAIRSLGHLRATNAVPLLARILAEETARTTPTPSNLNPEFGSQQTPVHLAGAAAEALGRIGTPEAESALLNTYAKLADFWSYNLLAGDHVWLMGCHASIPHFRIAEALDRIATTNLAACVPKLLQSLPNESDRALLFEIDSYESLTSRLIARSGKADAVVDTCLNVLGDTAAILQPELKTAVTASPPALSTGILPPEARAAQILSIVCSSQRYSPQILAAFNRYRAQPPAQTRSWVCFFLARSLGKLQSHDSVPSLVAALEEDPAEASFGLTDPPNVFLYQALNPCYRAAAAHALGQIGDRQVAPRLLKVVANFNNALDVRNAAAHALVLLPDANTLPEVEKLAQSYPEVVTRRILLQASRPHSANQ